MKIAVNAPRTIGSKGHLEYSIFFRVTEEVIIQLIGLVIKQRHTEVFRCSPLVSIDMASLAE